MNLVRLPIFLFFLLCIAFAVAGEHYGPEKDSGSKSREISYKEIIENNFLEEEYVVIQQVEFEGNQSTRKHILERELLFAPGDTLKRSDFADILEQSRENLLNTSLFNFVNITLLMHEFMPIASVRFTFVERWYVWPFPIFEVAERNLNDWLGRPSFNRVNYGAYIVKENFRGRMERISLLARAGYRQNYSISYSIPYIDKAQKFGIGFSAGMNLRNEIEYLTHNNNQLFYSEEEGFALRQLYVNTRFSYRQGIYRTHSFTAEFNQFDFADSLLVLNPQFSPSHETTAPFFSIGYEFRNDRRDVRAYPLRGRYFDLRLKRQGLGLLKNEKMDITSAETSFRRFWQLSERWYFASGINAKASFGDFKPYYLQQGLGFRGDLVRGYENFVIDGQHFGVLKSNFKFALLPSRVGRIGFIPSEKFSLIHYALYVNFFTDLGYVHDSYFYKGNPYSNNFLAGSGIGLDLVTYYDKVFRTEFAVTRHGDVGVHFHLIAPI